MGGSFANGQMPTSQQFGQFGGAVGQQFGQPQFGQQVGQFGGTMANGQMPTQNQFGQMGGSVGGMFGQQQIGGTVGNAVGGFAPQMIGRRRLLARLESLEK